MQIAFYAPFKPLTHKRPSGDLVTAAGLVDFLRRRGHEVVPVSDLRCRWIFWKPWLWPRLGYEGRCVARRYGGRHFDIWFSYHSYYKAPDLLGPGAARRLGIPYVLFQGIYSTKRRRDWRSLPGFYLNRRVLLAAAHVFANKRVDYRNLKRLLPAERVSYVAPGLTGGLFRFDLKARDDLRRLWGGSDEPVVLSVAMFRRGVKAEGLRWVIRTCGELRRRGRRFTLVIAGDGKEREALFALAQAEMSDRVVFAGLVPRQELYRYYSAADLFAFPGIQESLGMVYLEAQACRLPVVAFDNAGTPEAVQDGRTGILVPMNDGAAFAGAIERLLADERLRRTLGTAAENYIRESRDLDANYGFLEAVLAEIAQHKLKISPCPR
jgi:glycosyltransferase involved in cell wall biosynthesis